LVFCTYAVVREARSCVHETATLFRDAPTLNSLLLKIGYVDVLPCCALTELFVLKFSPCAIVADSAISVADVS